MQCSSAMRTKPSEQNPNVSKSRVQYMSRLKADLINFYMVSCTFLASALEKLTTCNSFFKQLYQTICFAACSVVWGPTYHVLEVEVGVSGDQVLHHPAVAVLAPRVEAGLSLLTHNHNKHQTQSEQQKRKAMEETNKADPKKDKSKKKEKKL